MKPIKFTVIEDKEKGLEYLEKMKEKYKVTTELSKIWINEILKSTRIFDDAFSSYKYASADLDVVVFEKNIVEFQKINPLHFMQLYRRAISHEAQNFFAEYITPLQLQYISKLVLRRFIGINFSNIIERLTEEEKNLSHYTFSAITKDHEIEILMLSEENIECLLSNLKLNHKETINFKNYEKCYNLEKPSISLTELVDFCSINRNISITNLKRLGFDELHQISPKEYTVESFALCLIKSYIPSSITSENKNLMPETGLYQVTELLDAYGVNLSVSMIKHAMYTNKIGFYKFSERTLRISKNDFEEYLNSRARKVFTAVESLSYLQRNNIAYISAEDALRRIYGTQYKEEFNKTKIKANSIVYRNLSKKYTRYIDDDRIEYFALDDINRFVSSIYGTMNDNKFVHLENNFTLKDITETLSINDIGYRSASLKNTSSFAAIKLCIYKHFHEGHLPLFKVTGRLFLIRKDDLIKIPKFADLFK